jgi:PmbA protein
VPLPRLLQAVEGVRADGARVRAWSVYGAETRRLTLGTRDGETGGPHAPLHLAESFAARYLLVWYDGLVSVGEIDRSELGAGVETALARARAAAYDDPDAAQVLGPQAMPEVALHDPGAARIASGETGPIAARIARIRERTADREFRTWSGAVSASESRARVVTSAGLDAAVTATSWAWSASFNGELGDGFRGRAEEPLHDFDARLRRLEDLVARLGSPAACAPSGLRPVILHPHVVESFVLSLLLENLDGASVARGESHFRVSQFGSGGPVLREDLTLRVDPLAPLKAGAYRFTVEGVPAAPCTYVKNGKLVTPVLNLKYARRLGLHPTAAAHEYDTLHLEGPHPILLEDAFLAADGGALVLHVLGVHAQDATSGDFSLSAPQALAVEKGRLGGRVRVTLSGNLFAALRSEKLRLVRFEGHATPGLLVECRLS